MCPLLLGRHDYRNNSDKCKITYPYSRYFWPRRQCEYNDWNKVCWKIWWGTHTLRHLSKSYPESPHLESVPNHVHDKSIFNQHTRSSLVLAQTSLTAISKAEAFKNEDIQMEANRLKAAFNPMNMRSGSTNYILTMDPELEYICALLEREADSREQRAVPTDLIQDFLQELARRRRR